MFDIVSSFVDGPGKRQKLFAQSCQALGLQPSSRPGLGNIQFHGRFRRETGISMGYYHGGDIRRYSPWGNEESIHIYMSVSREFFDGWWLELSTVPPQGHGNVPPEDEWQELVSADILAQVKSIPRLKALRLLTLTNDMRAGKLAFVLPHTWTQSVLHAILAPDLPYADMERALIKMNDLQARLLRTSYYGESGRR